jgi:amino acid adenylation domain-containing protein
MSPKVSFVPFQRSEIEQSISDRFEKQVRDHSNRLAVRAKERALTYDELNRSANCVAHAILAREKQAEGPIALLSEQGISAIATILAVLKAGHFYLSLDPSYPRDWLDAIVQDACPSLIVTDNANLPLAMTLAREPRQVLNIDRLDANISDSNPGLSITPESFAYLFYTSGSTGQPKGIVQHHRHVLHQIMTYTNSLQLRADDRFTLLHSHGFSASRLDIFGALLNGAALAIFSSAEDGIAKLARWLLEEQITVLHWVPTGFRHLANSLSDKAQFPMIRRLVLGSEPLSAGDVRLYRKHFSSNSVLVNRFGTTETGNARWYFIDSVTQIPDEIVPVGFAIEDIEVRLLDEAGIEVGCNEIGEITIESPYLSPGYWRQPELTGGGFSNAPTASEKKIYRTGDMGYMLPNGCLVHLGRKDVQVKIRGYRVDLGQIERALLEHPAIREAVVTVREQTFLVAHVVVGKEQSVTSASLRKFLEARLPFYMIPGAFVQQEALPLTPSGKLNRQALNETTILSIDTPFLEPRNATEKALAEIWGRVLGIDRVGVHDRFFDLGGHSLLAGTILSEVLRNFGVELELRDFLEQPTVAHMAEIISRNLATEIGDRDLRLLDDLEALSEEEARQALKK